MATTREYMEYIIDTLGRGLGHESFSMKRMFGEYTLYYHGTVVGLVCDGTLFIKITPETTRLLGDIENRVPLSRCQAVVHHRRDRHGGRRAHGAIN
jgi:hypothetical protein